MKLSKILTISPFSAASLLTLSPAAYSAEENKDKSAVIENAAKNTEAKMLEAKGLLEKNADKAHILSALNDARQAQKEFRYEQIEVLRQKLNDKLRHTREAVDNGDYTKALVDINAGLVIYTEMKKTYDAAHR